LSWPGIMPETCRLVVAVISLNQIGRSDPLLMKPGTKKG
jgi:hypothetical protein